MKKILIIGASGFVGRHLLNNLNKNRFEIIIPNKTFDLIDKKAWNNLQECETLIHLAAKTSVQESWNEPQNYINNNTLITTNALEYCRRYKSKLVLLSSYLYGNSKTLPIKENFTTQAINPYALSKLISEDISRFYKKYYSLDIIILRVFNIYGLYQPKHFLISKVIEKVKNSKSIIVNSLSPKRDYLYIEDLISAIIKSIEYKGKQDLFNIGYGESHSVEEVINIIQKIYKTNLPIINKRINRRTEIRNTIADRHLSKLELGWEPIFNLEKGLMEMIKTNVRET